MSNGTFADFLDAMRTFESGWDSARYATGNIIDAQLNQWAGGFVSDFYPDLTSWGQMSPEQWEEMSYRSENTLGFVGYQFGEALMIDLGYYEADGLVGGGGGAPTNTWEGTWTGKNGINSLDDFKNEAPQEIAIREAFGFNLKTIEDGLANAGQTLDDYLGTTRTYIEGGVEVSVTITMTGLLSAAHLRGAFGTLDLLLSDAVSFDQNGTSILNYMERFGGFDAPPSEELIAIFDENNSGGTSAAGSAGVTAENADVVITWSYGANVTISDFDADTGTIFVGWVGAADLEVLEIEGNTVFEIPSNAQKLTLEGVGLDDLTAANFTFLDATAAQEVLALVGSEEEDDDPADDEGDGTGDGDTGDDGTGDGDSGDGNTGDGGHPNEHLRCSLKTSGWEGGVAVTVLSGGDHALPR